MLKRLLTNAIQAWRDLGLRILPHGGARPLTVPAGAGLVFGIYMALADATLLRNIIPAPQAMLVSGTSSLHRLAYFVPLVVADEVKLRLVLMSTLVWMLTSIAGRRPWCFWVAILGTALLIIPRSN